MGPSKHDRMLYPVTSGARTLVELAALRAEGLDWDAIAPGWGMRPQNGGRDLRSDVRAAFENAGEPGAPPRPSHLTDRPAAWADWRAARDDALNRWLARLAPAPRGGSCDDLAEWEPCDATA